MGYSFRLAERVLLYAPSHRQDGTYHSLFAPVVEHWLERETAQWVHPMKDRSDDPSHHERTLLPRSYISLRQPSTHAYLQEVGEVLGENVCFVTQGLQVVQRKPDNVERNAWILEPLTQHLFKKHVVRLPWIMDNHSTSMKERKD